MTRKIIILFLVILLIGAGFLLLHKKSEPAVSSFDTITLNQDGTIAQSNTKDKRIVNLQNTRETNSTVAYVPKVNHEKTDVEYSNQNKKIYVKVNGKTHEIVPTVKETQKFQNGKVMITQDEKQTIEIKSPPQSRWDASFYQGLHGKYGVGLGYHVNRNITVHGLYIDNNPYVGVTVSIGSIK